MKYLYFCILFFQTFSLIIKNQKNQRILSDDTTESLFGFEIEVGIASGPYIQSSNQIAIIGKDWEVHPDTLIKSQHCQSQTCANLEFATSGGHDYERILQLIEESDKFFQKFDQFGLFQSFEPGPLQFEYNKDKEASIVEDIVDEGQEQIQQLDEDSQENEEEFTQYLQNQIQNFYHLENQAQIDYQNAKAKHDLTQAQNDVQIQIIEDPQIQTIDNQENQSAAQDILKDTQSQFVYQDNFEETPIVVRQFMTHKTKCLPKQQLQEINGQPQITVNLKQIYSYDFFKAIIDRSPLRENKDFMNIWHTQNQQSQQQSNYGLPFITKKIKSINFFEYTTNPFPILISYYLFRSFGIISNENKEAKYMFSIMLRVSFSDIYDAMEDDLKYQVLQFMVQFCDQNYYNKVKNSYEAVNFMETIKQNKFPDCQKIFFMRYQNETTGKMYGYKINEMVSISAWFLSIIDESYRHIAIKQQINPQDGQKYVLKKTDLISPPKGLRDMKDHIYAMGKYTGLEADRILVELRSLQSIENIKDNYQTDMKSHIMYLKDTLRSAKTNYERIYN